jgi:hypothetical protein
MRAMAATITARNKSLLRATAAGKAVAGLPALCAVAFPRRIAPPHYRAWPRHGALR